MNHYLVFCNLKDTHRDLEFADAIHAYLGRLKNGGLISGFSLTRRKLGFGVPTLGEFQITILTETLAGLDQAFETVAARTGELERLHANVYSRVKDVATILMRDFPDPQRVRSAVPGRDDR
ncbi:MAG: hypothetical protein HOP29_15600 [Phycisphaerales bacterium]|nr:hypothetical protein [Phycisphaerales bacterium]